MLEAWLEMTPDFMLFVSLYGGCTILACATILVSRALACREPAWAADLLPPSLYARLNGLRPGAWDVVPELFQRKRSSWRVESLEWRVENRSQWLEALLKLVRRVEEGEKDSPEVLSALYDISRLLTRVSPDLLRETEPRANQYLKKYRIYIPRVGQPVEKLIHDIVARFGEAGTCPVDLPETTHITRVDSWAIVDEDGSAVRLPRGARAVADCK